MSSSSGKAERGKKRPIESDVVPSKVPAKNKKSTTDEANSGPSSTTAGSSRMSLRSSGKIDPSEYEGMIQETYKIAEGERDSSSSSSDDEQKNKSSLPKEYRVPGVLDSEVINFDDPNDPSIKKAVQKDVKIAKIRANNPFILYEAEEASLDSDEDI